MLRLLDEIGSPATIASTGGRLFGGVIGGALPTTVAAHWLAGAWDQNACLFDFSPVGAYLEDVVVGWDVEGNGLFGAPPVSVVVGEEVHATMLKALAMLGFGRNRVHIVPADSQGRMKPSEVPRLSGPVIVCAQVGNVNTGACDPVGEICDVARGMDAWVHVDGAFGLWAATSAARAPPTAARPSI